MASAGKWGDNPVDCPVCLTGFDDLVQQLRILPCGHSVCTLCIDKLKEQGCVTCPECRISHVVPKTGQFPICYALEAVIRMMRNAKVAAATAASPPPSAGKGKEEAREAGKKIAAGLSKKMRSSLREQEATVVAAITACQEAQAQLGQYEATLTGWGKQQQQLEDGLLGLVDQSRSARELVQQETFRVAAKKEEAKKREQKLQAVLETLRTPTTKQEAFKVLGEVFNCTSEAEQVLEECQQCFPDAGILTTARKVREASSAALEAAQAVQAAPETVSTEEPRPQSEPKEPSSQSDPEEPSSQSDPEEPSSQSDPEEPSSQSDPEEPSSQSDPEEPSSQSDPEEPSSQSDTNLTIMEKVKFILEPSLKVQDNLSSNLFPSTPQPPDSTRNKKSSGTGTKREEASQTVSETRMTEQKEEKSSSENSVAFLFSKATAETTAKFLPSLQPAVSVSSTASPQDAFKFDVSSSNSAFTTFEFTPKPISRALAGDVSQSTKQVDKMKEPNLTPVPLPLKSLPKNSFMASPGQGLQSSPEGFKFSIPEIVDVQSASETLDNAPNFTFRNPTPTGPGSTPSPEVAMPTSQPSLMLKSSSSSLWVPKKEGSILDILKPKEKLPEKSLASSPNNDEKTVVSSKPFSMTNSDSTKSLLEQSVNSIVKKSDTLKGVQGFGSMFKKSSDEWECSVCMLRNQNMSVKCVACETQRPGEVASALTKDAEGAAKSSGSWAGNGAAWGYTFRKSASEWDCDMCMVRNKDSVSKCVACETPRPGAKSDTKSVPETTVDTKEKTNTLGFGSVFAKQKGEWECDTCLVRNKSDATKCISCETPKPGAANIFEAIIGNFKFGVNTTTSDSTPLGFTFKEKAVSSGFNFGVGGKTTEEESKEGAKTTQEESKEGAKTTEEESKEGGKTTQEESKGGAKTTQEESKGVTGFKFGVPGEKSNALTVHSSGSSAESDQPKDKVTSSSVGFSFGMQKVDTKAEIEGTKKLLLFGGKSADSVESVTSTIPAFQFGTGIKTHVAISFDSGNQEKAKEEQKANPSSSGEAKTGMSEDVKGFKRNEALFDGKGGDVEENTSKPVFGACAPSSNTTPAFQLGNSNPPARTATAPSTFGCPTSAFGSSVNSNSGFAFGQLSKKESRTGFDFGKAASSTGPSFNFAAVQPPSNPGLLQFGQSQTNNSSPGVFQFGSRNSEVQAPGVAFGNSKNPLTRGPPSGRVIKKGSRRSRE
ncbi:nuclear pore complex protein Nup153-like [Eriocheir sinensis]|uniref:nuclear pore complex protein Nup153-like n=1 Tax=Eriocheir sinensis TaxID=95602 RepID=UPI0021CA0F77|nr:nuclear pore complex protein Nup153-like [Eriocheir sinensis]